MKKELNNIEEIEAVNEEEVVVTEEKQKIGSKIVGGVKKHGKKVVGIVLGVAAVAVAYGLGKKSADGNYDELDEPAMDFEDVNFEDVTEE